MLVIGRSKNKAIMIGDNIFIRVKRADDGKGEVELIIDLPKSVQLNINERSNLPPKNIVISHKRKGRNFLEL
ncbi:carbon storage regulator [Pseudomonas canadensis]|uniref:carbon storage regulator n=1 Tax=Pseudomonas canadensis TaxID=915099 RepID=UPI003B9E5974